MIIRKALDAGKQLILVELVPLFVGHHRQPNADQHRGNDQYKDTAA